MDEIAEVRAEIERVKKNQEGVFTSYTDGKFDLCEHLLSFIDSMQKEPKDCMYSKDNYTDEDRKALCDGCEEDCKLNQKEELVSKDLQKEIDHVWDNTSDNFLEDGWKEFEDIAKHFFELGLKAQKGEWV